MIYFVRYVDLPFCPSWLSPHPNLLSSILHVIQLLSTCGKVDLLHFIHTFVWFSVNCPTHYFCYLLFFQRMEEFWLWWATGMKGQHQWMVFKNLEVSCKM